MISLALQHGIRVEAIQHAITRDSDGARASILGAAIDAMRGVAMSGKIDPAIPRIVQFLLLALSPGTTEGERTNAMHMARKELEKAGSDAHELGERIKASPALSEDEMKKIFDAGRAQGRAEEIEQRQRSTAITVANGDVGEGLNGYSWREIVGHCVANKSRIRNPWESNFVAERRRATGRFPYSKLTEKQTPIVRRIFLQWFNGTII